MRKAMSLINRILGTQSESDDNNSNIHRNKECKRVTGRIVKVDPKGFGFISSKDIPYTRIFFHWTGLQQDTRNFAELDNGLFVEFEPMKIEGKGIRAIKIKVIDENEVE